MIFGVDDRDRMYWDYPAFLDARDNPKGIDIEKGVSRAALQEVIAHAYREGSLTLFGLFSNHALSVSEIENAMQGGARDKMVSRRSSTACGSRRSNFGWFNETHRFFPESAVLHPVPGGGGDATMVRLPYRRRMRETAATLSFETSALLLQRQLFSRN